jgi:hypothetical protein
MWLKFSKLGGEVSYDETRHQPDIVSRARVLAYWELSLTWSAARRHERQRVPERMRIKSTIFT